jgi:hypothetical protein
MPLFSHRQDREVSTIHKRARRQSGTVRKAYRATFPCRGWGRRFTDSCFLPRQPNTEAADAADRERRQKEEEERLAKLNDRVQELRTAHEQSAASLTLKERELEGTYAIYLLRLADRAKSAA